MVKKEEHILVIRLSAMGDVAMTVPVLRILTATYPELKVTVLTRAFFAPMFQAIPNVQVSIADVKGVHKGIVGLFRLSKMIRNLGITVVADLHNVLRSVILNIFLRGYGITIVQIDKGRAEKKALTSAKHKLFAPLKTTHQRYADVFEKLGYPISLSKHSSIQQHLPKPGLTPEILALFRGIPTKKLGIAPFAQYESKTYPLALMEAVIQQLNTENNFEIILFGSKEEKAILEKLSTPYHNVVSIAGKLSFEAELRVISSLDGMLAMDSGNAHLAAMYSVPTITIWGVTHPFAGFMPFEQPMEHAILPDRTRYPQIPTSIYGNKVPEGYEKVMYSIPPARVVDTVNSILLKLQHSVQP